MRRHGYPDPAVGGGVCEVEVKYRVADLDAAVDALRQRGLHLSAPVHQDDQAYAPVGWSYQDSKLGVSFARLRTQDGQHVFTVKRPVGDEQICLEYECEVSDREQMHRAILAMGYSPTVRIIKTRRTATSGVMSLCLDEVEHAGVFLEVERLVIIGEAVVGVQGELDRFVRGLGVPVLRVMDTYDSLVRAAQLALV